MIKTIRKILIVAGIMFLPALANNAAASHFQGSELTYDCVAPGTYTVTYKVYRDCAGASAPSTMSLNIKATGCNAGRTITMPKLGNSTFGNPYCPQITATCSPMSLYPNYEEAVFTTTVTFTAAEMQCADWTLSVAECCRPGTANLVNPTSEILYSEAYLKLTPGINNSSPHFASLVVPYINHSKPIQISAHAIEPDGDSVVYSLKNPKGSATSSIAYQAYGPETIYNGDSTKSVVTPAGNYSANYPIHAYYVDWTQPMPLTPVPAFNFDPQTGNMFFIPTRYKPNSPAVQGQNKYVTVVQADEYRKVNGVMTKIGHVRRDMFITIIDCGPNMNPTVNAPTANGQLLAATDVINLQPGTPMTFSFNSADGNTNDVLNLSSDAIDIMPGAVFAKSAGNKPTGTITWTPTAAHVSSKPYYFHVTVMDNACPVKGYQTHTYAVRVSNSGGVTGLKKEIAAKNTFMAYPNPFAQTISFKLDLAGKAETREIVIFNTLGQQVDRISLQDVAAGEQHVVWRPAAKLPNGQYLARLVNGREVVQTIQFTKMQ